MLRIIRGASKEAMGRPTAASSRTSNAQRNKAAGAIATPCTNRRPGSPGHAARRAELTNEVESPKQRYVVARRDPAWTAGTFSHFPARPRRRGWGFCIETRRLCDPGPAPAFAEASAGQGGSPPYSWRRQAVHRSARAIARQDARKRADGAARIRETRSAGGAFWSLCRPKTRYALSVVESDPDMLLRLLITSLSKRYCS